MCSHHESASPACNPSPHAGGIAAQQPFRLRPGYPGGGHRQAVTSPRGVVGRRSLYSGKRSKTAVGVGHMWRPCERHRMKYEGVSIFSLPHRKACAARLFPPKAKDDRILTEMRAGHDVRRVEKRGTCLRKWRSLHLLRQIGGGCFRTSTDASAPIERVS